MRVVKGWSCALRLIRTMKSREEAVGVRERREKEEEMLAC